MELASNTFCEGMTFLFKCYKDFSLPSGDAAKAWYGVVKLDLSNEELLPLISQYCRTESAPTCPADIINFKRKQESK